MKSQRRAAGCSGGEPSQNPNKKPWCGSEPHCTSNSSRSAMIESGNGLARYEVVGSCSGRLPTYSRVALHNWFPLPIPYGYTQYGYTPYGYKMI
jgi:hypothetical protein